MAFFKFRNKDRAAKQSAQVSAPVQSLEELRRLAKYRLVGAAVLVLIGVVGLPLLLDRQPRPIPVNTPIDIPDRDKVLPLGDEVGFICGHGPGGKIGDERRSNPFLKGL